MEKINKMIKAYNKKAEKWGYETVSVENGELMPETFEPKLWLGENMSFIKRIKTMYRNGYLQEDYNKIVRELVKIDI